MVSEGVDGRVLIHIDEETVVASRIEIGRAVERVYEIWEDVDAYPRFMPHFDRIEHEGGALRVTSTVDGVTRSWPVEIAERVPNQALAWRALDGTENGGRVELRPRGEDRTEVALYLQVDARQFAHHRGDGRAVAERIEREALRSLREFIERDGREPTVAGRQVVDLTALRGSVVTPPAPAEAPAVQADHTVFG